ISASVCLQIQMRRISVPNIGAQYRCQISVPGTDIQAPIFEEKNMHLEQFPSRLQKLSEQRGLRYSLAGAASPEGIARAEQRLGVSFPEQVKLFYRRFNGLRVDDPRLEVFPVEQLNFAPPPRLHFATLDGNHRLHFDVSRINEAGQ